jgi:hypothetical protein
MADIITAARAIVAAYAVAVAKGAADPSTPRSELVSSMAKLYLPGWTSFTLGSIIHPQDDEATNAATETEKTRFEFNGSWRRRSSRELAD